MPRYRMKHGHRHYHQGKRYSGLEPGKRWKEGDDPHELELSEERAGNIANKLELISDIGKPVQPEEVPKGAVGSENEQSSNVKGKDAEPEGEAPDPESKEVSAVASKGTEQAPADPTPTDKEAPASESKEPEKQEDELLPLSAVHIGGGKWDVKRGDKKINNVPLSEDEAKALAEGASS